MINFYHMLLETWVARFSANSDLGRAEKSLGTAATPVCFTTLQRHEFDTRSSIPHVCTLAVERKRFNHRLCDEGRNQVILRTENKRVLVLH